MFAKAGGRIATGGRRNYEYDQFHGRGGGDARPRPGPDRGVGRRRRPSTRQVCGPGDVRLLRRRLHPVHKPRVPAARLLHRHHHLRLYTRASHWRRPRHIPRHGPLQRRGFRSAILPRAAPGGYPRRAALVRHQRQRPRRARDNGAPAGRKPAARPRRPPQPWVSVLSF